MRFSLALLLCKKVMDKLFIGRIKSCESLKFIVRGAKIVESYLKLLLFMRMLALIFDD